MRSTGSRRRLSLMSWLAVALSASLVCGCGLLPSVASPLPNYYSLGDERGSAPKPPQRTAATAMTLMVSPPHAAAGFDSRHIVYLRQPDQPEYFARNEWIDTPARMLAPLIVAAVERGGAFRAVVPAPSAAAGEMQLDTEILRLQHEFLGMPSSVRFTLRAYLVESLTHRVIATRVFEAVIPAASDDPHGGVVAARRAAQTVLDELSVFCAEVAHGRSEAGTFR